MVDQIDGCRTRLARLAVLAWVIALAPLFQRPSIAADPLPPGIDLSVVNHMDQPRKGEIIPVDWKMIHDRDADLRPDSVVVLDAADTRQVPFQLTRISGAGIPDTLLFQVDLGPQEDRKYRIAAGKPAPIPTIACGDFFPGRDDFAWENDLIAFRTYGPALEATGEISSGIDVWVKHVSTPVVHQMYANGDYHHDHGGGVDCYKVEPGRGCGGTGIWKDGKLYVSNNFKSYRVLANGPLRTEVELTYAPWDAGGVQVSEVKRITLDAGSHLNRMESTFRFTGAETLQAAATVMIHKGGSTLNTPGERWLGVWDPADGKNNGMIGTGIVLAPGTLAEVLEQPDQSLALYTVKSGQTVTYYAGAGWSKRDMGDASAWKTYLQSFAQRLASPLEIEWGPASRPAHRATGSNK